MKGWTLIMVAAFGCSKGPSAMDVCKQIEAAGVATGCRADAPKGIGAAAKDRVAFDLAHVPGSGGQVLKFDSAESFDKTVAAFEALVALAGPHRYGSKKALVFVQMNDATPAADGQKVRGIVEAHGELVAPPPGEPAKVATEAKSAEPEPSASAPPSEPKSPALAACEKIAAAVAGKCANGKNGNATMSADHVSKMLITVPAAGSYDAVLKGLRTPKEPGKNVDGSKSAGVVVVWSSDDAGTDTKIRAAIIGL